jgi:hypothetical protein
VETSPKELRPFAANILAQMAVLFRSIGAEEVLDGDPGNCLRKMNDDLAALNSYAIATGHLNGLCSRAA